MSTLSRTRKDHTLIKATAVYADLPLATAKPVRLKIRDTHTAARLLLMIVEYKRGRITHPYIKLTFTDQDLVYIKEQGIPAEGLTHFIFALNPEYDQEVTDANKRSKCPL